MELTKVTPSKCPKCSSIFVENKFCEACGYRFNVDQLGQPYDENSFFSFKKDWENWISKWWAIPLLKKQREAHPKQRLFVMRLKRRFFSICSTLGKREMTRSDYFLFKQELGEITKAWGKLGYPLDDLVKESFRETSHGHDLYVSLPFYYETGKNERRTGVGLYHWLKRELFEASFPAPGSWVRIYGIVLLFAFTLKVVLESSLFL